MRNRTLIWKVAALLAATLVVGACGSSEPNVRSITLIFVRNAQSQADADKVIETTAPGRGLSEEGLGQAQQVVHQINRKDVDSIYTSEMSDAKQTAQPLASELGKQPEVLPGLASIDAGWFNGKPESMSATTYMLAPTDWINGDLENQIPGSAGPIDGKKFNDQFTRAVKKIYDGCKTGGHCKPVVFSQGTAIMVWTLMNVKNPKTSLLTSHPLPNTGRVVINGNPVTGWTLVNWDGIHDFTS